MRKSIRILYTVSIIACIGGMYVNWKQGEDIIWPAIACMWCFNAFINEFKNYD